MPAALYVWKRDGGGGGGEQEGGMSRMKTLSFYHSILCDDVMPAALYV